MAYIKQPKEAKIDQKVAQGFNPPVASTPAPMDQSTAGRAPNQVNQDQRQSGTFTGFQKYVKANEGQGEDLAKKLGSQVQAQATGVGEDIASAKNQYESAANTAQEKAFGSKDAPLVERYFSSPSYRTPTTDEAKRVGELSTTAYAGPTGVETSEIEARAQRATERAAQLGSEQGRKVELQQDFGRPSYQGGQQKLDQVLLQTSKPAQDYLSQTSKNIATQLPQQVGQFKTDVTADATNRAKQVEDLRVALLKRIGLTPEQKPVTTPNQQTFNPNLAPEAKGQVSSKPPTDGNKFVGGDVMNQINTALPDSPIDDHVEVKDAQGNILYRGSSAVINTIKRFGVDPVNYFLQRAEFLGIDPIVEPSEAEIQRQYQTSADQRKQQIVSQVQQQLPQLIQAQEAQLGRPMTDQEKQALQSQLVDQQNQQHEQQLQQDFQNNLHTYQQTLTQIAQKQDALNIQQAYLQELQDMLQQQQAAPKNVFTEADWQHRLGAIQDEIAKTQTNIQNATNDLQSSQDQQGQLEQSIKDYQKYYNLSQQQADVFTPGQLTNNAEIPQYQISGLDDYLDKALRSLGQDPAQFQATAGKGLEDSATDYVQNQLQGIFDNYANASATQQQLLKDAYNNGLIKVADGKITFNSKDQIKQNLADPRIPQAQIAIDNAQKLVDKGNYYKKIANDIYQEWLKDYRVGRAFQLPDGLTIQNLLNDGIQLTPQDVQSLGGPGSTSIQDFNISRISALGDKMINDNQADINQLNARIADYKANPPVSPSEPQAQGIEQIAKSVTDRVAKVKESMTNDAFNLKGILYNQGTKQANLTDPAMFKSIMGRDPAPGEKINLYGLNLANYIKLPTTLDDQQLFYGAMTPEEFQEIQNMSDVFGIDNPYQNTGGYELGTFKPGVIFDADQFRADLQNQAKVSQALIQKDFNDPLEGTVMRDRLMRHSGFDDPTKTFMDSIQLMSGVGASRFGPNAGMGNDQILNLDRDLNNTGSWAILEAGDRDIQKAISDVNSNLGLNLNADQMFTDAYRSLYGGSTNVYTAAKKLLTDVALSEQAHRTTDKGGNWVYKTGSDLQNYINNTLARNTDYLTTSHEYRTAMARVHSNVILNVLNTLKSLSDPKNFNMPTAGQRNVTYNDIGVGAEPTTGVGSGSNMTPIGGFEVSPGTTVDNGDGTITRRIS